MGQPVTTMLVSYPNHTENGREYHGYRRGMYLYPCDGTEQQRMDYMAQLFRQARNNKIHEYPLISHVEPPRVLDLGCGTGLWCMEMAEMYPHAEIWGMDLVNILPPHHLKPETGRFEQVELDIEPRCDDGTLPPNASIRQWYTALKRATETFNRPIAYNHATREMLARQGFVEIEERVIRLPMSTWSPHMRERVLANWYQLAWVDEGGLEAYSLGPLTRAPVSWPADEVIRFCKEVGAEISNRDYHIYNTMYVGFINFLTCGGWHRRRSLIITGISSPPGDHLDHKRSTCSRGSSHPARTVCGANGTGFGDEQDNESLITVRGSLHAVDQAIWPEK
ncbi:MAG: hypothetical protein Q9184_002754 [Pyrenodesmia sp. 2 TL-2023]